MFARFFALAAALMLAGCSAIEAYEANAGATREAAAAIDATVAQIQATAAAEDRAQAATIQALLADATAEAQTLAQLQATLDAALATASPDARPSPPETQFSAATVTVFGSVPLDSERLNTIAALAFDSDGQLLVAMRAGEIYRLIDLDDDGAADETQLLFRDDDDEIGQVSALLARGSVLLLVNDGRLHALSDGDGDGVYDSARLLSSDLPQNQDPLRANNSLAQSADGRLFSADVKTGEILRITLHE